MAAPPVRAGRRPASEALPTAERETVRPTDIDDRPPPVRPLRVAMVIPPWYQLPPTGHGGESTGCAALRSRPRPRGDPTTAVPARPSTRTARRFPWTLAALHHPPPGEATIAAPH